MSECTDIGHLCVWQFVIVVAGIIVIAMVSLLCSIYFCCDSRSEIPPKYSDKSEANNGGMGQSQQAYLSPHNNKTATISPNSELHEGGGGGQSLLNGGMSVGGGAVMVSGLGAAGVIEEIDELNMNNVGGWSPDDEKSDFSSRPQSAVVDMNHKRNNGNRAAAMDRPPMNKHHAPSEPYMIGKIARTHREKIMRPVQVDNEDIFHLECLTQPNYYLSVRPPNYNITLLPFDYGSECVKSSSFRIVCTDPTDNVLTPNDSSVMIKIGASAATNANPKKDYYIAINPDSKILTLTDKPDRFAMFRKRFGWVDAMAHTANTDVRSVIANAMTTPVQHSENVNFNTRNRQHSNAELRRETLEVANQRRNVKLISLESDFYKDHFLRVSVMNSECKVYLSKFEHNSDPPKFAAECSFWLHRSILDVRKVHFVYDWKSIV